MKRNDIFTFIAPNGEEVTGVIIYKRILNKDFVNYIKFEYIAYAQNRLFTCTQMERIVDKENYASCPIEYGKVLVEYAILPDYDELLARYNDIEVAQAETQSGI